MIGFCGIQKFVRGSRKIIHALSFGFLESPGKVFSEKEVPSVDSYIRMRGNSWGDLEGAHPSIALVKTSIADLKGEGYL